MGYRTSMPAPVSRVPEARRGRVVGIFCLDCGTVYPLNRARHAGKPLYGQDHIAASCPHEGEAFDPGEGWWEPAVEVSPEPAAPAEAETAAPGSP